MRQAQTDTTRKPGPAFLNREREPEEAADEIISSFPRRAGVYPVAALDRRMRRERPRAPMLDESRVSDEFTNYIVERQIDELVEVSRLTSMQEIAFRLCAGGLSGREIAACLGIKHQTITFHLRSARRKVRAAYREGPYAGWYEVYLSEVRRGTTP